VGGIFIVRGDEPVATDYTILPTVLIYITFKRILARQDLPLFTNNYDWKSIRTMIW